MIIKPTLTLGTLTACLVFSTACLATARGNVILLYLSWGTAAVALALGPLAFPPRCLVMQRAQPRRCNRRSRGDLHRA